MDILFHNDPIPFKKRVFKGLIIRLILIWTFLLIWFFTVMSDDLKQISVIVFFVLSFYLTISTIPKLRNCLKFILWHFFVN